MIIESTDFLEMVSIMLVKTDNPRRLLWLFVIFSAIAFVTICGLTYFGIKIIYTNSVIREAQNDSASIGKMLSRYHSSALSVGKTAGFEKFVRDNMDWFNIVKIKVYLKDGAITYSTDRKVIDEHDVNNRWLTRALHGEVISKFVTKDKIQDLKDETRFNVKMVKTYVPIKDQQQNILGGFEIYRDITPYKTKMSHILRSSVIVVASLLFIVFLVLFLLMKIGVTQIFAYQKKLQGLASKDGLTGLFNRYTLMSRSEEMLAKTSFGKLSNRSILFNKALSCIMLDIDHFKSINDRFGHLCGDMILKEMAQRLALTVREYDILGRYGGEEFVVVMPRTSFDVAQNVAKRLWAVIRDEPFVYEKHKFKVTVSVGVASIMSSDLTINDVIKRADQGMYKAKESGRDRIESIG